MATYILRKFDKNLASTGFSCMMLTGSHFAGSLITDDNSDIKGISNNIVSTESYVNITIEGQDYYFTPSGKCTTSGYTKYRLMLADSSSTGSLEEILSNIYGALLIINETISSYCGNVSRKLEDLQQQVDDLKREIPDISGLASKDYVDEEIEDVNDRIDSYHPQR